MLSPFIKTLIFFESACIFLLPISLVISITLSNILIYTLFLSSVLLVLFKQKDVNCFKSGFISEKHIHFAFLIYILSFAISRSVNSGIFIGFNTLIRLLPDYILFLLVFKFSSQSKNNRSLIVLSIFIAAFISIKYGLLQYFGLDLFDRQKDPLRLSGFHHNPYTYGGQLLIFLFFLLNIALNIKNKKWYLYFLAIGLLISCLFCILGTAQRAVIIGVTVGLIFYFILSLNKQNFLRSSTIIVLLSSVSFVTFILNKALFHRFKGTVSRNKDTLQNVRIQIWKYAVIAWKKNIFFGSGKFPTLYYQSSSIHPVQVLTHAHNIFLQVLATNGILGFLGFVNLLLAFILGPIKNLRSSKYSISLVAIMVGLIIEGIFEYFWGDSEVKYLLLYYSGFVFGTFSDNKTA